MKAANTLRGSLGTSRTIPRRAAVSVGFAALISMLTACSKVNDTFIDPKGPIAEAQRTHLIEVTALTMVAILPVLVLLPIILWRYRYSRNAGDYAPQWDNSSRLEFVMWAVPFAIVGVLSILLWRSTIALDPYRPLPSKALPLNVQVIGLDWKWLFIYPNHGVASVGELAFPAGQPLALTLTTDTVMQSFMISALGGQIYAMPGMTTKLNLLATQPGVFKGENTQYSGEGFHQQKFKAKAMTASRFQEWIAQVKATGIELDAKTYSKLAVRSTKTEAQQILGRSDMPEGVIYFRLQDPDLVRRVIGKYRSGKPLSPAQQPGTPAYSRQHLHGGTQ
ncbi:MAG: cytochrome ubiquinol oxidase subunit II [Hyphomicrobiaceae bacterium]